MSSDPGLTEEQKQFLEGFLSGSQLARSLRGLPGLLPAAPDATEPKAPVQPASPQPAAPLGPEAVHRAAQDRFLSQGKKLSPEEQAKRDKDPFALWDEMQRRAAEGGFPKGTDVFLYKFHGLFYVAPAQNAFMCRLRFAGGATTAAQFRGVADLAERFAGGYADVTTRANLQLREIGPRHALEVLTGLADLGILNRGAGADNVRNITATPTAGFDPQELCDTLPLARQMHHYILQHRELYGLPRKFNIAFDGGGTISALADTNDIGFVAVRVGEGQAVDPGVYFRMELGGITGHGDFARDTGLLLAADECVSVAAAAIRVFLEHGDRTDRKKARLKYLLDQQGLDWFLEQVERRLGQRLRRFPREACEARAPADPLAHVGIHPQRQPGLCYVGVVLPVGRMTAEQMRGLAEIAERHGSRSIRLTVWQNLLIPDIPRERVGAVQRNLEALGLHWSATEVRAGLVACTGNGGCKFAASNTKGHALQIANYLEARLKLDQPLNIHLTGCHHSCAQHYIGDIGLLATKVPRGEELIEGYHVYVGGGHGAGQQIGRELCRDVPFDELPARLERILSAWQARGQPAEPFHQFARRHSVEQLREYFSVQGDRSAD